MNRIENSERRDIPDEARRKLLRVYPIAYYVVDSYVAPLVSVGLSVIEKMTAGVVMRDWDEDDRDDQIAAYRDADRQRIEILSAGLAELVEAAQEEIGHDDDQEAVATKKKRKAEKPIKIDAVTLCGICIDWPHQRRALKTWAGQSTLAKLIASRLAAMSQWDQSCDALDYECGIQGVCGLMPGQHLTSLDIGFSPNEISMKTMTHPWREIALMIGVQFAPIVSADHLHSICWSGDWHSWRVVDRNPPYLFAWKSVSDELKIDVKNF